MERQPYLNLGCGNVLLPCQRPVHHSLVSELIYAYPDWLNVDKHTPQSLNGNLKFECVDVFTYPWPWIDNSFDGALLAHIVEHVPHEIKLKATDGENSSYALSMASKMGSNDPELQKTYDYARNWIKRCKQITQCQDGWYAFFAELYRVLIPGAIVHVLSPYGWSQGAITDPTHTRMLTEHTFEHSMKSQEGDAFWYENGGIHFEVIEQPVYRLMEKWRYLNIHPTDDEPTVAYKQREMEKAFQSYINVVYDFYVRLQVIK